MINTPYHLGGHLNKTHVDEKLLNYLIKNHNIVSMLDIGCGPGGMIDLMRKNGYIAYGIDGDPNIVHHYVFNHDFTKGIFDISRKFDLVWSVEFLEHVEEKYIPNFMPSFQLGRKCVITHAGPKDIHGHHHVNLQESDYWIDVFESYGFQYDSKVTKEIRNNSNMKKGFIKKSGLFFINKNLP